MLQYYKHEFTWGEHRKFLSNYIHQVIIVNFCFHHYLSSKAVSQPWDAWSAGYLSILQKACSQRAQEANLLPMMPACHDDTSSSPTYSTWTLAPRYCTWENSRQGPKCLRFLLGSACLENVPIRSVYIQGREANTSSLRCGFLADHWNIKII